jgi:hypothetical protein
LRKSPSDGNDPPSRNSRRVSWSTEDHLQFIETKEELLTHKEDMWYDRDNFVVFKTEAMTELTVHMQLNNIARFKDATSSLYQPNLSSSAVATVEEKDEEVCNQA